MKYLILGAGPAGLTVANMLLDAGVTNFLVIEKEKTAGGLCRSVDVDGSPLDIGGGHFLDVRRPNVNEFLFRFMPKNEWNLFDRNSKIAINGQLISHPIEANIWQMNYGNQIRYLKSIAAAGCNLGIKKPHGFEEWVYWKFGSEISENYMIPYNEKVFGKELNQLGTYWLDKLPNVSFDETLRSCLEKKAYGTQPGHAQFYYPYNYGYGELWLRMAAAIGKYIVYDKTVSGIDFVNKAIKTSNGESYQSEYIITTIPWNSFDEIIGMPEEIKQSISGLKNSSVQVEYIPNELDTKAHWVYYPDPALAYHRILVRHNFCRGSKGYWTETNSDRVDIRDAHNSFRYNNLYAYPLNTIGKPQIMKNLLNWCKKQGVIGLGRWGEHQHYNSDVTVDLAMRFVYEML